MTKLTLKTLLFATIAAFSPFSLSSTANAQMEYIYRGNYGLTSLEEILDTGVSQELAEEMMQIEKRQEVLVGILRDIASEHPEVRDIIMQRLSAIAKEGEVITVVHDVQ